MFTLDNLERPNTATDIDADVFSSLFVGIGQIQLRALDRETAGRHRKLDEAAHLLHVLLFDVAKRIEVLNFACNAARKLRGVELSNGANAILAL